MDPPLRHQDAYAVAVTESVDDIEQLNESLRLRVGRLEVRPEESIRLDAGGNFINDGRKKAGRACFKKNGDRVWIRDTARDGMRIEVRCSANSKGRPGYRCYGEAGFRSPVARGRAPSCWTFSRNRPQMWLVLHPSGALPHPWPGVSGCRGPQNTRTPEAP
ncbi:hypothetical protein [Streptomyces decoyicus]|uniref:hypothetical protein n=1 Tax=Streptomyces decoyicus TaxID=249567 RepID=UPI0038707F57|nr:hypothetical protein OG532_25295 [Streptomyces decoyicus]